MPPNRGTDLSTEQRQLRPREEESSLSKWLQNAFDATAEVLVFAIPILAVVFLTGDVEVTFVLLAALCSLVLGVAVQRHRPLGLPWPGMTPLLVLVRLVVYNVALAAGLALGGLLFADPVVGFSWVEQPILGPSLVAALVAVVAVVGFPYLASVLGHVRHG